MTDILAGVQNYSNELPEVQTLLGQLVLAIDALRGSAPAVTATAGSDPLQPALKAVIARQAPASAPEQFEISTSPPTPVSHDVAQPEKCDPMVVVGESLGDKRERDQVDPSEPSESGDTPLDALQIVPEAPVQPSQLEAAEREQSPVLVFGSHEKLRRHLMETTKIQAQRRSACTSLYARR